MKKSVALTKYEIEQFAKANGRVALTFAPSMPTDESRSFVGGYPCLPVGMEWPVDMGVELMFLAQIDISDLPWLPESWPVEGTLYLFLNPILEGSGHLDTQNSFDEKGEEHATPFVYFASAQTRLESRQPTKPLSSKSFLWYTGNGDYRYSKRLWLKGDRYRLPRIALKFAKSTQYYPSAWLHDRAEESGLGFQDAYAIFGEQLSELDSILRQRQNEELTKSLAELDGSWGEVGSEEDSHQRIYGGAPHIDVDGLLQTLPEERTFNRVRYQSSADPRYASWPETGGTVMYHATAVLSALKASRRLHEKLSTLTKKCAAEAGKWVDWGTDRRTRFLDLEERKQYLSWARSIFKEALKVYARSWRALTFRKYFIMPFGKRKGISLQAGQARVIANSLVYLSDAQEFGLQELSEDQTADLSEHAKEAYLRGLLSGQLFGWGNEIQNEVQGNSELQLLASLYGNRDVNFEADFKIWLTQPLQPDAWQTVRVTNAV